jgi:soluble lytic murein transglycosylase-like protein
MARLGIVESGWNQNAVSSKGCLGIFQVDPKYWEYAIYTLDSGKVGKILLTNNNDTKWIYHDIKYGIELGCKVFRWWLDISGGDYKLAAEGFGGFRRKNKKKFEKYFFRLTNDVI